MKHDPHQDDDFNDFMPEDEETSIVVNIAGIVIGTFIVLYCVHKLLEISL
jgi:hypothetical protein